jgi:hypothetical protein
MVLLTSTLHLPLYNLLGLLIQNIVKINKHISYHIIYFKIEWLLFNANSGIFQLYYGENKFIFNEVMMRSALY